MGLITDEDRKSLLFFKDNVDYDGIKVKEQVKKILLGNDLIIKVLDNEELEESEAEPDDYFGVNIRPYYLIPETQSNAKNFICYTVSNRSTYRKNDAFKPLQIIFYILCRQEDIIEKNTGIARHDLLAALIQQQFNFTTLIGGGRIELIEDIEGVTDSNYATRTLFFEQLTDNNLVKNGRFINKDVQRHI